MRELYFVQPGVIEWRERPAPQLDSPRAALVRPLAVSRCDLDQPIASGRFPVGAPFALGHEFVAEVVSTGDAVQRVKPGQRVSVSFQISCGECERCLRGHTGSCTAVPPYSAFGLSPFSGREFGGALADLVLVPYADAMLVPLPQGLDPWLAAAVSDNAADGWRCVAQPLAEEPGARVLVVGGIATSVGLYAVAAARALGAGEVVYVDRNRNAVAVAERLGAKAIESAPRADLDLGRFPVVVDASSIPEGLRMALSAADIEGTVTCAGINVGDVPIPTWRMYMFGVRFLTGRVNARANMPAVLDHLANGSLRLGMFEPTRIGWEDAPTAWAEPALKLVVER